ncbi:HAD family hydrolase [uncultured Clostridium sp.]|uniref:HAD family hydrolase n=1 Tax=uncultured Clostridium sp. TaxID=59620 RepID=UPI0028EB2612|nr:HAD family hydrolase [uncultured Clostridium sp.]
MGKYDTVIFDLDGTLLNTIEDLTDSVNFALGLYGFPHKSLEEIRSFVGNGATRLIELSIPDGTSNPMYKKCFIDFRNHYSINMRNKTDAYEGIMELLRQLLEKKYKMAIVSNKFDTAVKELNKIYFEKYIKAAIGESEKVSKKPAPDTVFKALEELGSVTDKSVYVGDSEVDVKTAKNAGVICVGVTWGFRNRKVLEQNGADYIIDTPQELLKIITV